MIAILACQALAAEPLLASEPQPAPVHDEARVFDQVQFDTGWWPNKGDVVSVRFHITPTGGISTDIDADSQLQWPYTAMEHRLRAMPQGGLFRADAAIEVAAELKVDIFGLYSGVVDLWTEEVSFDENVRFESLLLAGAPYREVDLEVRDRGVVPVDYTFGIIPGLNVVSSIRMYPELEATMRGLQVTTDLGHTQIDQTTELDWNPYAIPATPLPEQAAAITWEGELTSLLNLVIEPVVELDTILGDFELVSIPLDVTIVDQFQRRQAETMEVVHPLPALDETLDAYAFGEVEVGQERSLELPLANLGAMLLEGELFIDGGDGQLTVYPDTLVARPEDEDGVVVTFSPTDEGLVEADLVIWTNAPHAPEVRIPLTGMGWVEPDPTLPTGSTTDPTTDTTDPTGTGSTSSTTDETLDAAGSINGEDVKSGGCGCQASAGIPAGAGALLLVLLPLLRRQRRRR